jgi:hypothetical protein
MPWAFGAKLDKSGREVESRCRCDRGPKLRPYLSDQPRSVGGHSETLFWNLRQPSQSVINRDRIHNLPTRNGTVHHHHKPDRWDTANMW